MLRLVLFQWPNCHTFPGRRPADFLKTRAVRFSHLCPTPLLRNFYKLKAFPPTKVTKKQLHQESKCLKSRLLWAQMHDGDVSLQEQYLELPCALADESGIPNKGQKSNFTAFYSNRYGEQVVMCQFPLHWIPNAFIVEGMFVISPTLLRIHSTQGSC